MAARRTVQNPEGAGTMVCSELRADDSSLEGCQTVVGGRSEAQTTGQQLK